MFRKISLLIAVVVLISLFAGCEADGTVTDIYETKKVAANLQENQPTPTDIDYSLELYNLVRRAYWVNGQREKARTLPCQIADIPLGYIVLVTENGGVLNKFVVEGKVSSLNSFLTPDSYSVGAGSYIADVDGSYGENDDGIFFFTPDGKYIEWTGTYLYSDIPFEIANPIITYEVK